MGDIVVSNGIDKKNGNTDIGLIGSKIGNNGGVGGNHGERGQCASLVNGVEIVARGGS